MTLHLNDGQRGVDHGADAFQVENLVTQESGRERGVDVHLVAIGLAVVERQFETFVLHAAGILIGAAVYVADQRRRNGQFHQNIGGLLVEDVGCQ